MCLFFEKTEHELRVFTLLTLREGHNQLMNRQKELVSFL